MGSDAQDALRQELEMQISIHEGREGETRKNNTGNSTQKGRNKRMSGGSDTMIVSQKPGG